MKELNKQHYIHLTTETPLSILADAARWLSPYADFIVSDKGDYLYYIDNQLVEKALEKKPEFIDDYVNGVRDGMNGLDVNRSNFDLKDFMTKRLGISLNSNNYRVVKAKGQWLGKDNRAKKTILQTVAKEAERLYLSGSSLKGAMRTAILYDWLMNTTDGQAALNQTIAILKYIATSPNCLKYNELLKEKQDLDKKRQRLSTEKHQVLKSLERELHRAANDAGIFDEEQLFGKLIIRRGDKPQPPIAQYMMCRDSRPIPDRFLEATFATRIRRIPAKNEQGSGEIPIPREAISKGATIQTSFAIRLGQIPENHALSYWNKNTDDIMSVVGHFSKQFVRYEIEKLEEGLEKADSKKIEKLLDFYTRLQERMLNGEQFMRIGSGKTFYDNSLVLSLLTHPDKIVQTESATHLRMVFPAEVKSLHPVTRTISADGLPFGWLKIAVANGYTIENESITNESEIVIEMEAKPKATYPNPKKALKANDTLEATILKVGIPNRLKLHIRPDFEPEINLTGYKSAFPDDKMGEIIIVKITSLTGKGDKMQPQGVSFAKFK
jgi:CRISPR type III-A-associated RAMP protein Csm5